jgi:hypothetical protein
MMIEASLLASRPGAGPRSTIALYRLVVVPLGLKKTRGGGTLWTKKKTPKILKKMGGKELLALIKSEQSRHELEGHFIG